MHKNFSRRNGKVAKNFQLMTELVKPPSLEPFNQNCKETLQIDY